MRDNNARCAHIGNSLGDGVLIRLIEIGRAFIEEQRVRLAIKRAGQQDTLALPARQCRAHITDQAGIAHWHRGDLLMHPRDTGAILDPGHIQPLVEKGDVVGERARQQQIILQHRADARAPRRDRRRAQRYAIDQNATRSRRQ